jgi:hypothetical protein
MRADALLSSRATRSHMGWVPATPADSDSRIDIRQSAWFGAAPDPRGHGHRYANGGRCAPIGDSADAHAGLALLRVAYSDGSQGTITISSRQAGTPLSVFMGITATKGFVGYWVHQAPVAGEDGERALFHVFR